MEKQLSLFPLTQCAYCREVVPQCDVLVKQYYNGQMVDVEHFCSHDCHFEWYIRRLRQWGI